MHNLTFKLNKISKRITCAKTSSVQELCKMIQSIFSIKDRVIGITDQNGKFFDLEFVNENMGLFKSHVLSLVIAKDNKDQNMSFASDNIDFFPLKKQANEGNVNRNNQQPFSQPHGLLGYIEDLQAFQHLFLEDKKPVIVICTNKANIQKICIPYNFYIKQPQVITQDLGIIIIYFDHRKVGELYIKTWKNIEIMIQSLLRSLNEQEQNMQDNQRPSLNNNHEDQMEYQRPQTGYGSKIRKSRKNYRQVEHQYGSDQQQIIELRDSQNQLQVQEIKHTFLENLIKLRDQQTISELQFYKLKSKLLQNPQQFMRKYQMGTRQGFRKHKSIDELRDQIVRSKQEKSRYQTIINEFRQAPVSSQNNFNRSYKNQIPIIVRKYNNVIQKISTSYPLTLQQQQAINLIMELQLKGLISENDSRDYKAKILQEDESIFQLFQNYFDERIDQIQLTRKLKNKHKIDRKTLEQKSKSEQIMRCIIKYAKRNSFQLLRNLALERNPYIMKCFEKYQQDKDQQNLATSLEKVSNYYRTKKSLESRLHIVDL